MAEGGALLRRYTGLNPYRGFESLSLRHTFHASISPSAPERGPITHVSHLLDRFRARNVLIKEKDDEPRDDFAALQTDQNVT